MPGVDELDPLLQSLQALKPPGASKSKITAITTICVDNPQVDATIAQKLYSHFKKTLPTHKLGVLFVVDSVTRQWIEKAKQAGQELAGSSAPNGTYASGVQRLTELMPSLIDDLVRVAPQDQKAKIQNLVDIWDRGSTFPAKMIADFRQRLSGPSLIPSSTPPGSPPAHMLQSLGLRGVPSLHQSLNAAVQQPVNPPDAASLLQALAGFSNPVQPTPAPPSLPPQVSAPPQNLSALLAGLGNVSNVPVPPPPQPPQQVQAPPQYSMPPQFQQPTPQHTTIQTPALPPNLAALFPGPPSVQAAPPPPENPLAALANLLPPNILNNPQQLTQALQLFGELAKNNIPQDQWGPVLAALYPQSTTAQPPAPAALPSWQPPAVQSGQDHGSNVDYSRKRDRSRSPDHRRDGGHAVNRRPSPVYGTYNAASKDANEQNDSDSRGRRQGAKYRQRTPPKRRESNGTNPSMPANQPKWISHDPSIPQNSIKVLSRTLFVGGCAAPEHELRAIFARFGEVQTCIANPDKRHAFVKMCTRADAVAAKEGMEELAIREPSILSKARQTKWGVGFGPRDCCDYATGESIIPLSSLTEADLKWALNADYGGTGGRNLQGGMVMEEPDIEIGAGVSSKAMSKRLGPDQGGKGRNGRGGRDGGRFKKGDGGAGGANGHGMAQQRYESPRPQEQVAFQPPPPVPNFGFQFAMPGSGGMPY
ncbi:hypothetical protein K461DRAFT_275300 [Myriangium duriaei CBS 260.36]|uniref:CID domain-containing protein n=1 Tax=Myriangium duriaei CBS 260.36 TaxID=1168546 RepID=A0A9P4J7J9_9PEZI|nr:hypothetical protein K461DRAFT_275300 [Myriangium duriaei CBS 260.36]